MSSTQLAAPQAVRPRARTRGARALRALPDAPWTPADRVVTGVVMAVGVLLIVLAWLGASDTTDWDTQLGWTALSMAGVVVVCIGVGIWLFRGFTVVRAEARAVRRELAARLARRNPSAGADLIGERVRVTVPGMAHSHRPDCLLVTGKATVPAGDDLAPCGVCA